jgi:hypothetical protein
MDKPPDPGAAPLPASLEPLVTRTVARLRSQVRWYQTLDPPVLQEMVRQDYQALGEALATNDMVVFRRYVEQSGEARLRAGAPAASLIAGISLLEEEVLFFWAFGGTDPAGQGESTRQLQSILRNMRMILSGVNLRLLTATTPPPRPAP